MSRGGILSCRGREGGGMKIHVKTLNECVTCLASNDQREKLIRKSIFVDRVYLVILNELKTSWVCIVHINELHRKKLYNNSNYETITCEITNIFVYIAHWHNFLALYKFPANRLEEKE